MAKVLDKPKTITEIVKKIFLSMSRWNIPLTPDNYRVWFEYSIGGKPDLVAEIDSVIEAGGMFTKEVNEKLHKKYFGEEDREALMKEIQRATMIMLSNSLEGILATANDTSDFTDKLQEYARTLNDADQLSEIQHAVAAIIVDTNTMAESSLRLQKKLEEATAQAEELTRKLEELEKRALTDAVTGLPNRVAFEQKISDAYTRFRKEGAFFSIIIMDIDHFKKFNDKYGHNTGDEVLRIVGRLLRENLKGRDFSARYGGEEFVILLPLTTLDGACAVADQIRKRLSEWKLRRAGTDERLDDITASFGVAKVIAGDTMESLVDRADKALYLAKDAGRNTVRSERSLKVGKTG